MTEKPARITVPPAPSRLNPGNNMAAIGDAFFGYFQPFANYMGDVADFTDERADAALAAALGGDLPPLTGKAGQLLGVNVTEDAGQFFHPAATLGAPVTKTANFTLGANENVIICNGSAQITATLNTAVIGRIVRIENNAAFAVVSASANVAPLGSATAGTAILPAVAGAWADLQWNGTQWNVIAGVTGATGAALARAATPAAAQTALGQLYARVTTTDGIDITSVIPGDTTRPQSTEGTQILIVTVTPLATGQRLLARVDLPLVAASGSTIVVCAALFANDFCIGVSQWVCTDLNHQGAMSFSGEVVAPSTSPITFTLRVGPSAGTAHVNKARADVSPAQRWGGAAVTALTITGVPA